MPITIKPTDAACGATVTGVDLTQPLSADVVAQLRTAWLQHHVLVFPDQPMSDDDQERFSQYFGEFGDDPFIAPIAGREHIIAVQRAADEKAPIFAEVWHTDWSFQAVPPAGTCLRGLVIPPHGGDTGFINQHLALAKMPAELRTRLEGKMALHSARSGYGTDGMFADAEREADRSMTIVVSEQAHEVRQHPIFRKHPETGEEMIYGALGYIIGFADMEEEAARQLLFDLYAWQTREEFQYQHPWQENMLVMWDNRSVLHTASGGYEGYSRLLHRTTIADSAAY